VSLDERQATSGDFWDRIERFVRISMMIATAAAMAVAALKGIGPA